MVFIWPIGHTKTSLVSILHKYDYDFANKLDDVFDVTFQFYISTIMTGGGLSTCDHLLNVSILHKYDYDNQNLMEEIRSHHVSILHKYDYDHPERPPGLR